MWTVETKTSVLNYICQCPIRAHTHKHVPILFDQFFGIVQIRFGCHACRRIGDEGKVFESSNKRGLIPQWLVDVDSIFIKFYRHFSPFLIAWYNENQLTSIFFTSFRFAWFWANTCKSSTGEYISIQCMRMDLCNLLFLLFCTQFHCFDEERKKNSSVQQPNTLNEAGKSINTSLLKFIELNFFCF